MKTSNLLAFLGGAVAGGLLALLTTPKTGAENRKIIADKVKEGVKLTKNELEELSNWIKEQLENFKNTEEEIFIEEILEECPQNEEKKK